MTFSWEPVQLSLFVASIATVIGFSLAIITAYFIGTKNFKGKPVIETIFFLPLVLPPSVIGFMLIVVFGVNSPVGQAIESIFGTSILFTTTAAVIAAMVVSFPLMYQSIKTGFVSVDKTILEAAKIDGASEWRKVFFIIIPLAKGSILTGIILGFTRAFGEFGATLMFAGNVPGETQTIPTAIYLAIQTGDTNVAWIYVLISIGFSFILLLLINRTKPNTEK